MIKKISILALFLILISTIFWNFINYEYQNKILKSLLISYEKITFKESKYRKLEKKINEENIIVSKFGNLKFKKVKLIERDSNQPLGYLEIIKDEIIYLAANGDMYFFDKNSNQTQIKNNLNELIGNNIKLLEEALFNPYFKDSIRDLFFHKSYLYVVLLYKEMDNENVRLSTAVLRGKFNKDLIEFEFFFKPDNFTKLDIDHAHIGGRVVVDDNDNFFLAVPDYDQIERIYENDNIFGKVVKIKTLKNFEIISKGHRNPQGLFYDKKEKILLETEHGPSGGDEINLIKKNLKYGWPTTSLGAKDDPEDPHPIYHNHLKHGFEKPLFSWRLYNPGISQIIKISENSKFNFKELYMVSSLSGGSMYTGNHLYIFSKKENKFILEDKIYINDRIRDLIYDSKNDRIILALESQESLGIISSE